MSERSLAVIVVATGLYYEMFFDSLRESIRQHLGQSWVVHVFCFCDTRREAPLGTTIVRCAPQEWPFSTLLKFHYIDSIADKLRGFDLLVFMDCDMRIVAPIAWDDLDAPLFAVRHPGWIGLESSAPFELDPMAPSYVPLEKRHIYYQGCLFGGRAPPFLRLASDLRAAVDKGLQDGQIPVFDDESYLNWYLASQAVRALAPEFAHPEGQRGQARILHLKKKYQVAHAEKKKVQIGEFPEAGCLWKHLFLRTQSKTHRLERRIAELEGHRAPRKQRWRLRSPVYFGARD